MPNKYYYVAVSFILNKGKLFLSFDRNENLTFLIIVNVNCLLASLNARSPLRDQMYRSSAFVRNTGIGEVDSRSIPSVSLGWNRAPLIMYWYIYRYSFSPSLPPSPSSQKNFRKIYSVHMRIALYVSQGWTLDCSQQNRQVPRKFEKTRCNVIVKWFL